MSNIYSYFRRSGLRNIVGSMKRFVIREKFDYSQNLEYTKLKTIFDEIPVKIVLDIGAHDGKTYSNSFPLVNRGWRGYLVEPNPENCKRIAENCEGLDIEIVSAAVTPEESGPIALYFDKVTNSNLRASIKAPNEDDWSLENLTSEHIIVQSMTIDDIANKYRLPSDIGLLTIDIEGLDTDVIQKMTILRPYVIIIEIDFSSLERAKKRTEYLLSIDYIQCFRVGCNEVYLNASYSFFERMEIKKFIENNF